MRKTRPERVPPIPRGGGVLTTMSVTTVAACRFTTASPTPRSGIHLSEAHRDEASTAVHSRSPIRPSPHQRPRMEQGPLRLLPLSFAPRRYRQRTSEWGRASEHLPGLRHQRHRQPPIQRATCACDLVSHSLPVPSAGWPNQDLDTPDSPTTEGTSTPGPAATYLPNPRIQAKGLRRRCHLVRSTRGGAAPRVVRAAAAVNHQTLSPADGSRRRSQRRSCVPRRRRTEAGQSDLNPRRSASPAMTSNPTRAAR